MATTTKAEMKIPEKDLHAVPLTIEGSSVLHQMFRFRWAEWRKLDPAQQHEIAAEASAALLKMENDVAGQTAVFSLLGHKGDFWLSTSATLLTSSRLPNWPSRACGWAITWSRLHRICRWLSLACTTLP